MSEDAFTGPGQLVLRESRFGYLVRLNTDVDQAAEGELSLSVALGGSELSEQDFVL